MNDATLLDDLDDVERQLVRALRVKADQVLVDDEPFDPTAAGPTANVIPLAPRRTPRRRVLVAAAAVVAVAGLGAAALAVARQARVPGSTTIDLAGQVYSVREQGTAGFVASALPDGWTLRNMNVGATMLLTHETRWQLFTTGGSPQPGLIVGSARNDGGAHRSIRATGRTVRGRPAEIHSASSVDPSLPPGAIKASWSEDGVVHDALAIGMDEDALVAALDGLVARGDPAAGFDAPAGAGRTEVAQSSVGDVATTSLTYGDPAGGAVDVVATSGDYYGGLLHRLAGVPAPGGYVRHGNTSGDPAHPFVSLARDDGWTIDVSSRDSVSAARDPAVLDAILAALVPVTTQQLVDIGIVQPVTARYAASGWTVEVHGTPAEAVAMCLTPDGGTPVCTIAEDAAPWGLVAGSALVDGRWVVVTVSRPGAAGIRTVALDPGEMPGADLADITPRDTQRSGVLVVAVPAGAEAVEVQVPMTGGQAVGFVYERPGG